MPGDSFFGNGMALLLLLAPVAPLAMLLALARPGSREKLFRAAPWAALPALLLGLLLPGDVQLDLPGTWWQAGLILDDVARFFLVVNALLWLLSGIFATAWFRGDPMSHQRDHLFMAFYLAAMAGHFGLTLALDIPTFYLCYSLFSTTLWPKAPYFWVSECCSAAWEYTDVWLGGFCCRQRLPWQGCRQPAAFWPSMPWRRWSDSRRL